MFSKWWLVLAVVGAACAKGATAEFEDDGARQDAQEVADCGDGVCGEGEACDVCVADCGSCDPAAGCGDTVCDAAENCNDCPTDCGPCGTTSGNTTGATSGVTSGVTSSGAGGSGGFGFGGYGGGFQVICGDGYCDPPETDQTCPQDCQQGGGTCAHDYCMEGAALDANCDPCVTFICGLDSFCCDTEWDDVCAGDAQIFCGCS